MSAGLSPEATVEILCHGLSRVTYRRVAEL